MRGKSPIQLIMISFCKTNYALKSFRTNLTRYLHDLPSISYPSALVNLTASNYTCNLWPFSSLPFSTLRPASPVWTNVWHVKVKARYFELTGDTKNSLQNSGSLKYPIVNDWNPREMVLSSQWRGVRNNRVRISGIQLYKTKTKDSFLPVHQKCPFDEHELWQVFRTWHALLLSVPAWWSQSTRLTCSGKTGFSHPWSTKKVQQLLKFKDDALTTATFFARDKIITCTY